MRDAETDRYQYADTGEHADHAAHFESNAALGRARLRAFLKNSRRQRRIANRHSFQTFQHLRTRAFGSDDLHVVKFVRAKYRRCVKEAALHRTIERVGRAFGAGKRSELFVQIRRTTFGRRIANSTDEAGHEASFVGHGRIFETADEEFAAW